jgi:hypothetical protein
MGVFDQWAWQPISNEPGKLLTFMAKTLKSIRENQLPVSAARLLHSSGIKLNFYEVKIDIK